MAGHHVHAEGGIALDGVVRLDPVTTCFDACHHGEVHLRFSTGASQSLMSSRSACAAWAERIKALLGTQPVLRAIAARMRWPSSIKGHLGL